MNIVKIQELIERYELNTKCRKREKVYARVVLFNYFKKNSKMSLAKIGSYFNRDHATILNGLKNYKQFSKYEDFKHIQEVLEAELEEAEKNVTEEMIQGLTELEQKIIEAKTIFDFWKIKHELIDSLS